MILQGVVHSIVIFQEIRYSLTLPHQKFRGGLTDNGFGNNFGHGAQRGDGGES